MIIEWPVVDQEGVERLLKGAGGASSAAVRRLASKNLISKGVAIRPRVDGHQLGRIVVRSALNLDATRAFRVGNREAAERLASTARVLEAAPAFSALTRLLAQLRPEVSRVVLKGSLPPEGIGGLREQLMSALQQVAAALQQARLHDSAHPATHRGARVSHVDRDVITRVFLDSGDVVPMTADTASTVDVNSMVDLAMVMSDSSTSLMLRPALDVPTPSAPTDHFATPLVRISEQDFAALRPSPRPRRRVPISG